MLGKHIVSDAMTGVASLHGSLGGLLCVVGDQIWLEDVGDVCKRLLNKSRLVAEDAVLKCADPAGDSPGGQDRSLSPAILPSSPSWFVQTDVSSSYQQPPCSPHLPPHLHAYNIACTCPRILPCRRTGHSRTQSQ